MDWELCNGNRVESQKTQSKHALGGTRFMNDMKRLTMIIPEAFFTSTHADWNGFEVLDDDAAKILSGGIACPQS